MKTKHSPRQGFVRPVALLTAGTVLVPTLLAGCSGGAQPNMAPSSPPPGIGSTVSRPKQGMSGKQKMMLLAGAAALYYIYNKRKNAAAANSGQVQYYRSETSGRIYYRDPKNPKNAIFVSPPTKPIQVPMGEAQQYQGYQGYNNQASGREYGGFGYNPNGQYNQIPGAVPAEPMM